MSNIPTGTLILTRSEVAQVLDLPTCIEAVEAAFLAHGEGRAPDPAILAVHVDGGGFHTKAGTIDMGHGYFAAKTNANFMHNRRTFDLPTIQGTIALHDAAHGYPLAVMDSVEISILRTGAATAVAARRLARPDATTVAIAGCGAQGRVQLRSLAAVLPLTRAMVWDIDPDRADALAAELTGLLGFSVVAVNDFAAAAREADICVTCTPSEEFILRLADVRPGSFVAGVGVDNPHKKELHPDLLAGATLVVDIVEQCATIGDLHHALDANAIELDDVHANLGAIVAGRAAGRTSPDELTVFDSTGMALQDVATAAVVYERAIQAGVGRVIDLMG